MPMTIWKFPLNAAAQQDVEMPAGAHITGVRVQQGQPCLWAIVDSEAPKVHRRILTVATGDSLDAVGLPRRRVGGALCADWSLIGIVQIKSRRLVPGHGSEPYELVFHVFDGGEVTP